MILSHELKLIFVKTKKVGGTSFEIALSKYCGESCIITPISEADERTRADLGFRGPQNYKNPRWRGGVLQTNGEFFNHVSAPILMRTIPPEVWSGYTKITIYRNPFDTAISRYYWEGGERMGLTFGDYVLHHRKQISVNARIAPLSGEAKLDHYLKYEDLEQEIERIGLGYLWPTFKGIRSKSNRRPREGASMEEVYQAYPEATKVIGEVCAEEIAYFGYTCPGV